MSTVNNDFHTVYVSKTFLNNYLIVFIMCFTKFNYSYDCLIIRPNFIDISAFNVFSVTME